MGGGLWATTLCVIKMDMKYRRIIFALFLMLGSMFGQESIPLPPPEPQVLVVDELNKYEDDITRIDYTSSDYLYAKEAGVWLFGLVPSECEAFNEFRRFNKRIIYKTYSNDTLRIAVNFIAHCCVNFLGDLQLLGDTLNMVYYPTGEFCDCGCCYSLEYAIKTNRKFVHFKLNNHPIIESDEKYKTFPIKYDIVDGDTINRYNKYNEPIGIHIKYNENGDTLDYSEYYEGMIGPVETKSYYPNGEIKFWYKRTFLESRDHPHWKYLYKARTREWDKNGSLIRDNTIEP